MKQFRLLEEFCDRNNFLYDSSTDAAFKKFYDMLIEKNKVMNLTAITEINEVEQLHFLDSIEAAPIIRDLWTDMTQKTVQGNNAVGACSKPDLTKPFACTESDLTKPFSLIDMGTGAGFPGIPLKLLFPDENFLFADSLNKRINFINDLIADLQLTNASAVASRAEELGQCGLRESFDFCVSRAVADMSVLLEYCLPMVRVGGYAVLFKSGDYHQELARSEEAMKILGGRLKDTVEFNLNIGSDKEKIGRSLIIIEKIQSTPAKYPRRPGKPSKSPIV